MPDDHGEARSSRRAFWTGTITFGLVNIPVDLHPAIRSRDTSMRMVDPTGRALGRRYYCPKHDKPLDGDDLVRGYETDDGRIVVITDEELDELAPEMTRDIELRRFVPLDQIPSAYFDHPYILVPAGRSTKAYHLLAEAIRRSGRVGIGTFVMRGHQYLVVILADAGVLRAETLRFADQIRSPRDLGLPTRRKVHAATARRIAKLVDRHTCERMDEADLTDRYAEALHRLAREKLDNGEDVVELDDDAHDEDDASTGSNVIDLMAILKQRLGVDAPAPARSASARKRRGDGLEGLTKKALYERARRQDIPGRTSMSKNALIDALRRRR